MERELNCRETEREGVGFMGRNGKKKGITFFPTTKIFDPKIETYQRTSVDMTFSRLFLIPKWNHLSSCPK